VISGVDPEAWLVVLPADHVIGPIEAFQRSLRAAEETLRSNPAALVTFGIAPTRPETGYGYIRLGEEIGQPGGLALRKAIAFKEKPNSSLATQYLEEGSYVWNSGIFVWMASTICQELSTHCPELHAGLERIATAWKTTERDHVLAREFGKLPRLPIDKAVLEKSSEVYALEVPYRWSDVGDWRALAELIGPDELGNVLQGRGHLRETRETIVISDSEGTIATLGVEGLLIVQSGGVTLVARRERLDELKALVEGLDHLGLGDLA
jgi:mannose-1-phosphate guanylyltransferase